jgi:tetratricopeptide (TPR) repeat protein/TolB-like protein
MLVVVTAGVARQRGWLLADAIPVFAVGLIRDDADTEPESPVLTDMLATNLARVSGLRVLANSRLLELMRPGGDSAARYADAANRAGATHLLEGRVSSSAPGRVTLEVRRVDLHSGIVMDVYQASAANRHELVDSLTRILAADMGLTTPSGSVADVTTTSLVAYRFYEEGLRAYHAGDVTGARRLMHAALREDSSFAMAAWYEARFAAGGRTPEGRPELEARARALRLAANAPERERLTIIAHLMTDNNDPRAVAAAESLTVRYPEDPQALLALSRAYLRSGNFAGAANAGERAIVLDSTAQHGGSERCRWCDSYAHLAEVYSWWDSLPAAIRTMRRFFTVQPDNRYVPGLLAYYALLLGDSARADEWHRKTAVLGGLDAIARLRYRLLSEDYDAAEREAARLLTSDFAPDRGEAFWMSFIALRNQGRLADASALIRTPEGSSHAVFDAILAQERGDPQSAVRFYRSVALGTGVPPGVTARELSWRGVRVGMAAADANDSATVRLLADSVEHWGQGSLYGRDPKLHHYLRGRLHAMAGRHEAAVREYRAAIHSPSLGFTRVNEAMARSLLQLGRAGEAVAILRPALRGAMDASNLYISRTDLHELLAEAFDQAGQPDSAAAHYRQVVSAWRRADPVFHARRDRAAEWLARMSPRAGR